MALANTPSVLSGGLPASLSNETFTNITVTGSIIGANGQTIIGNSSGAWLVTANGTNQSITLTPSGSGDVAVVTTGSTGRLTVTNTTGATANSPVSVIGQNNSSTFVRVGNNLGAGAFGVDGTNGDTVVDINTASRNLKFTAQGTTRAMIALTTGDLLLGGLTVDDTVNVLQNPGATLSAVYKGGTNALTGAGAISVATDTTKLTTAGTGDALTLANGTDGQMKRVILDVLTSGGHTSVITPATKTGYTTVTLTAAGQSVTMEYVTTRGWIVTGNFGATIV